MTAAPAGLLALLLGALCWGVAARAGELGAVVPGADPAFHQLAMGLRKTPRGVRADFALAAVREMSALYRAEIRPATAGGGRGSWSRSVAGFAAELEDLAAGIDPHTPVSILAGPDATVHLQIDGRPLIISGPRPAQQAVLERRIARHFCGQYPCDGLVPAGELALDQAIATLPHWRFRVAPVPSCSTGDGLELLFNSERELPRKRALCRQLFAEWTRLAGVLARESSRGVSIDWESLAVGAEREPGGHRIVLNARGDEVLLALPASAASPRLVRQVLPWLIARVEGYADDGVLLVVTNTEAFIAEPLP